MRDKNDSSSILAHSFTFFCGEVTNQIKHFAFANDLSPRLVAARLAEFLSGPTYGEGLGSSEEVSLVRGPAAEASFILSPPTLHDGPHSDLPETQRRSRQKRGPYKRRVTKGRVSRPKEKVKHSAKGFKYKGTHWMQKPENKARVQALAKARAKARALKKAA